ncbi:SDR family oxidoreductase [Enterovibrio sp. ZSDZ35]|uniref:SDR family oxidoreductase n=1 Tax=Enterovibrio qingdaonensis TaxID=2899818 RepID=A0ABT5QNC0_9GAMM|nr:SDR family oxidoreductase [Enterovibrio sp. ZSDZ35]MDD1782469.1 SDR family oxidoreductase [Enterovibrio sp. ZSDZ35]
MQILVTGATGFVGKRVAEWADLNGHTSKKQARHWTTEDKRLVSMELSTTSNWEEALCGVDCVVHCAALVHQPGVTALSDYEAINVAGTLRLAEQASAAGVKRFIFLSSIKVNGESTKAGTAFTEQVLQPPEDPYGLSKYLAEQGLMEISERTGLEVVIIRPPLVYGPDVKANFLSMINWVKRGIPLPLGSINNARSLVYVGNLVDFIGMCMTHPKASGEVFVISDDEDLSVSKLLQSVARCMNINSRVFPFPVSLITLVAKALGKEAISERLAGNLQVDITKAKQLLGWHPPHSVEQGLRETVKNYQSKTR